jgi:hypothetical protein
MSRSLLSALVAGALYATACGSDTAQSASNNVAGAAGSERDGASSSGGNGGSGASTSGGVGGESGAGGSSAGVGGVRGDGGSAAGGELGGGGSAGTNAGGSGGVMPPPHTGGVAGASTISCGTTTCAANQVCVVPCCGGSPGFVCTPAPPHCVDVPASCNGNVQPSCVDTLCFAPTVERGAVVCHCA